MPTHLNQLIFDEIMQRTLDAQNVKSIEDIDFIKLYKETNIEANTLNRFFKEYRCERKSKTLKKLAEHFKVDVDEIVKLLNKKPVPKNITDTFKSVWDGTDIHAQQIVLLLKASHAIRLGQFKESRS